ncbi:MAG: LPS export ABC transporter ATP-binding protein [Candidatus Cloacimonas sp. 4484_140]|nr:MAG: LPS export ABC transporter ATP-binding protein [Candidatus Cloacimonas sp. 4484_140]HHI87445.1 LPS export ABC transporter ATP-binding protein [Candidatus Cloacimonadota bacterium]
MEQKESIIRTQDLVKIYGKKKVVNQVSIEVRQGEIVGLLGPNGAGKTTTFHMMIGLIKANSGHFFIDDVDIIKMPMYKRARMGISYLSQEPSVFSKLTVKQNIMAILETQNYTKKERKSILQKSLNELDLAKLADQKAYSLSGGERRKLEITRSLITRPKFLFLDEPFSGVDPLAVSDIQDIIIKLQKKNIGILITDHNVLDTLQITDRAYIIYEGKVLLSGTSRELVNDPQARKIYLGERFLKYDFN